MSSLKVNLAEFSYPIIIGNRILKDIGHILKRRLDLGQRIMVVTNPYLLGRKCRVWFKPLKDSLVRSGFKVSVVPIPYAREVKSKPDLEQFKTNKMVMRLYDNFLAKGLDRTSTVVTVGGGVTGDLAAFAASTYMRGINLVHVPTTLMAQVDSSIGGKTGINLPKGKNLAGTFYQPRLVYIDIDCLKTKPPREMRGGFAEVIKYGVIKDRTLFYLLERNLEAIRDIINIKNWNQHRNFLTKVITCCCQIKSSVVERDECETKGLREILNYGHTVGHALEQAGNYKLLHHGEAVSIGMVAACWIAQKMGLLKERDSLRQENLLEAIDLPTRIDSRLNLDRVMKAIEVDKKSRAGELRFILPKRIGEVIISSEVPFGLIRRVLKELAGWEVR